MQSIVTGSSGFIGSRLSYLLEKEGYDVVGVSRHMQSRERDVKCDLEKDCLKEEVFKEVNSVFHLAGHAHDLSNPKKSLQTYIALNVDATIKLALQSAEAGVKNFIFISSVKAGTMNSLSEPVSGEYSNIYGGTKLKAESELLRISKQFDMKVCIVRPALVYGKEVKGNLSLIKRAIEGGWCPPLPKIYNKRSMIHVDDLVKAIVLIEKMGENGQVYTVTDGYDYSTTEIYDTFLDLSNKPPPRFRLPLFVLKMFRFTPGPLGHKIGKLLEDDKFSSSKIESLGFQAQLKLRHLNETLF